MKILKLLQTNITQYMAYNTSDFAKQACDWMLPNECYWIMGKSN